MMAGLFAARNIAGAELDLWSINEEESFHEEVREDEARDVGVRDRLTPSPAAGRIEDLLQSAFARYDEVAAGGAMALTAILCLTVATGILPLVSDPSIVPMLSLIGQYLFGYEVSWPGLAVGVVEVGLLGFGLGWVTAKLINLLVRGFERSLERRLAVLTTFEDLEGGRVERK